MWFYKGDNRVYTWPTHRIRGKTAPERTSYNCMLLYGVFIPKPVVSLELILHDLSVRNLIVSLVEYSPTKPQKTYEKVVFLSTESRVLYY